MNTPFKSRHAAISCLISIVFLFFSFSKSPAQSTWAQVRHDKRGKVVVCWYESQPFILKDASGKLRGIEFEIIEGFKTYLREAYQVELQIEWKESRNFGDTYATIKNKEAQAAFGVSAFSITPERKEEVDFSPPYMTDICVLISSQDIPIAKNAQEFKRLFANKTAITIRKTTYEKDLQELMKAEDITFQMSYIPSSENVLYAIASMEDAFGFIDLPVYMMIFNEDPSVKVRRQNLFPIIREGYGIISPKGSDWTDILAEYFDSKEFKARQEEIIGHYIDRDLYHFVENLARQANTQTALLTKEKEIQQKGLEDKLKEIEKEEKTNRVLLGLIVVILVSMIIIILLYRKRSEQKKEIEVQRQNIELKSQQLEKRNQHLMALDEEKNNLIKILAHDLRSPINHVQGLAQVFLLSNPSLPESEKMIIQQIVDSSVRLNKMIVNLLDIDAIESGRVGIINEKVNLPELAHQVVKSFEKPALRKDIELSFQSGQESLIINGDPLFLTQIFENLISNAIKFSPKGRKVEVSVVAQNGKVRASVRDQGPGLTEDDLLLVFKKFQRLSASPTDGEKSIGLGLAIVKKYVELMSGNVTCESQYGKGAEFIITFDKV